MAVGLAVHGQRPGPPVDVVQCHRGGLAGPQAKSSQHGHDREVASPHRSGSITGAQQILYLGCGKSDRETGQPPRRHRRDDAGQRPGNHSGGMQEHQQGAQSRHRRPRRSLRQTGQPPGHEGTDVGSGQRRPDPADRAEPDPSGTVEPGPRRSRPRPPPDPAPPAGSSGTDARASRPPSHPPPPQLRGPHPPDGGTPVPEPTP